MGHKGSLLYPQTPTTGPYPEPDKFNPHLVSYFFNILISPSHSLRDLPTGLKRTHSEYVQNKAITYTYKQEYISSIYASDPTLLGISLHIICRTQIPCKALKKITMQREHRKKQYCRNKPTKHNHSYHVFICFQITFAYKMSFFGALHKVQRRCLLLLYRFCHKVMNEYGTGGGYDNDAENPKHPEKSLSQYNSVHHKSQIKWPGISPGLPARQTSGNPSQTCTTRPM
jgi:hypothetical protein